MKFEVIKDNSCYYSTTYIECIPTWQLKAMKDAGYKFRVDGKISTLSSVLSMCGSCITSLHVPRRLVHAAPAEPMILTKVKSDNQKSRKIRPIRCNQNGQTYKTMSEAGRALNIDPAAISYSLKVNRPTTSGYTFSFIEEG